MAELREQLEHLGLDELRGREEVREGLAALDIVVVVAVVEGVGRGGKGHNGGKWNPECRT